MWSWWRYVHPATSPMTSNAAPILAPAVRGRQPVGAPDGCYFMETGFLLRHFAQSVDNVAAF